MAIVSADGLVAAATQTTRIVKTAAATTIALIPFTTWDLAGLPGAGSLAIGNTANGLVPTDSTAGAPLINAFGGGASGYLTAIGYRNTIVGGLVLYDRLFHAGSFVCATLHTDTLASQPAYSGRLPGTDYSGLEILVEINAAMAASATTVAITYTNEAGTTGRATGASASMSGFTTRRIIAMPLQAGDKGVQKIESVIVGGATNATGTLNVIVARRLWQNRVPVVGGGGLDDFGATGMPEIYDTSCLWLVTEADSTGGGLPEVLLTIKNG